MNSNRYTLRQTVIKMDKSKEKIPFAASEKQKIIFKGIPISLSADLSAETIQARGEQHDIYKINNNKNLFIGHITQQDYHLEVEER